MTTSLIGGLRYRVELQARQRTPDEGGGAVAVWATVASLFAQIKPVSGHEIVSADGRTGRVSHEVVMRYSADVQPGMHIVQGARTLIVHAVLDMDGRRRWLKCLCEERLP